MIQEVDEDDDGAISFREFMLIFRKAAAGELQEDSGLGMLAKQCEINVEEVGVGGAKDFFEAKVNFLMRKKNLRFFINFSSLQIAAIRKTSKFEEEIHEEQESRKREEEEKKQRQQSFKERAAMFGGQGV